MPEMSTYRCKICGRERSYADRRPDCHPFCCERCKMIDLGRWFNEQYVIDSEAPTDAPLDTDIGREPPM